MSNSTYHKGILASIKLMKSVPKMQPSLSIRSSTRSPNAELMLADRWRKFEKASSWALQGEVTVQTRLNNFLLADSVLILSWSTLYTSSTNSLATDTVLMVLASLSLILSITWTLGARRWQKFNLLQWAMVNQLENDLELDFASPVDKLRKGKRVIVAAPDNRNGDNSILQLTALERLATDERIVSWPPAAFGLTSLVLIVVSVLRVLDQFAADNRGWRWTRPACAALT